MALIKMLESVASSEGWAYHAGQVLDISAEIAELWVKIGRAERIREPETAMIDVAETATPRLPKNRKGVGAA